MKKFFETLTNVLSENGFFWYFMGMLIIIFWLGTFQGYVNAKHKFKNTQTERIVEVPVEIPSRDSCIFSDKRHSVIKLDSAHFIIVPKYGSTCQGKAVFPQVVSLTELDKYLDKDTLIATIDLTIKSLE